MYFKSYLEAQILHDFTKTWNFRRYKDLELLLKIFAIYSSKPLNMLNPRCPIERRIPDERYHSYC